MVAQCLRVGKGHIVQTWRCVATGVRGGADAAGFASGFMSPTFFEDSIAHNNVNYDEISQIIEYFPEGGGIKPTPAQQIYFLDFMRMILVTFREVNNLHHFVKCLFYYEYLILQDPQRKNQ